MSHAIANRVVELYTRCLRRAPVLTAVLAVPILMAVIVAILIVALLIVVVVGPPYVAYRLVRGWLDKSVKVAREAGVVGCSPLQTDEKAPGSTESHPSANVRHGGSNPSPAINPRIRRVH